MGTRAGCGDRQRSPAGVLDVPLGTRASALGVARSHRRSGADPVVRAEAVRRLRRRFRTRWSADTAGGGVGAVAGRLLRVEGIPVTEPARHAVTPTLPRRIGT